MTSPVTLYRSSAHPGFWIGHDKSKNLVIWPAAKGGWVNRTTFTGDRRRLQEVPPAEARRTGWPGAGTGRKPRAGGLPSKTLTVRLSEEERADWAKVAKREDETSVSNWIRVTCNAAAKQMQDPLRDVKRAKAAFDAHRDQQEALGFEVCLVVVGYVSGREPFRLLGRVSADTGMPAMPDPPLTDAEMQPVAFAAKMALAKVLRARKKLAQ